MVSMLSCREERFITSSKITRGTGQLFTIQEAARCCEHCSGMWDDHVLKEVPFGSCMSGFSSL